MKGEKAGKPRLVFFGFAYLEGVTPFQLAHRAEHLKCLEQFFDVSVVSHDCDYRAVCDAIQPSLVLFETGLEIQDVRRPKILGARADNAIPKLALANSDGISDLRPAILSDVDALGIDALFSISLVAMEHLKGVADRLFVWPNFVDPGVFRDYEQPKAVPLLFTGSLSQTPPSDKSPIGGRCESRSGFNNRMKNMNHASGNDGPPRKPTLLFLQYGETRKLSDFMLLLRKHQVQCLRLFFDVIIQNDCDYQEICERYQPDLTMIEMLGGVENSALRKPRVSNMSCCTEIPKIAFLNADSWCGAYSGFRSDMDRWGVQAAFSICTTAAEHMPQLGNSLYVWPNSIDSNIYRDYGQPKVIPFLIIGHAGPLYPWRRSVHKLIADNYPSLICPHFGYKARMGAGQFLWGESYARTISSSWFVPTCGTVAREILRKHFEIPACGAALITEESAALKAAGFVDMKNCVFATASDLLDKVDYLFRNQDKLAALINAGHDLVHSHHTIRNRDQILQWLMLHKDLSPGQRIVQDGPFSSLRAVQESSGIVSTHLPGNGAHLLLLREGQSLLVAGEYEAAEECFRKSDAYTDHLTEPKLGLALCRLHQGDARSAANGLQELVRNSLVGYKAAEPDPVEWACYLLSQLCIGDLERARSWAEQFPLMRHPELDRVKWVLATLTGAAERHPIVQYETTLNRTIHMLPSKSMKEWVDDVCRMLKASGQERFAEAIAIATPPEDDIEPRDANVMREQTPRQVRENGWLDALRFRVLLSDEPLGRKVARVAKRHMQESLARLRHASRVVQRR